MMTLSPRCLLESFIGKLARRSLLPEEAREALLDIPVETIAAGTQEVIAREGEQSDRCLFVVSGFVSRRKERQVVGIGVAGDAVDLQSLWLDRRDYSIVSQTPVTIAAVKQSEIIRLCERSAPVMRAFWHDSLVEAAILREWSFNIGHRRAQARLAYFFLEVSTRLQMADPAIGNVFELPLTQGETASALGLSLVHVNKCLRALREAGHINTQGRTIVLLNRPALVEMTGFDASYLQRAARLQSPPAEEAAVSVAL